MPNNPAELYSIIKCLFPEIITKSNGFILQYWEFINKYCTTKNNGFGIQITGGKNLDKLRDFLRGKALRRKKDSVLKDLPKLVCKMLPLECKLDNIPKEEQEIVEKCLNKDNPLQHLKEIGTHIASLRKISGLAKVDAIINWVKESPYKKIVLFAHHKSVIKGLKQIPKSVVIEGSSTESQREKAVERFQYGDARVFIGQIEAAGTGLTLTKANVLVLVECDYTPANNKQAADRIHRIGQEESCLVYFASIPNSIDQRINEIIRKKLETYKQLGL